MNTPNGNFIETSIPNNNATITLNIAGKESTMKLVDFVNAIKLLLTVPTLQEVTDSGNTTTENITVNLIEVTAGVQLPNNILQDIGVTGAEPVVQDAGLLFTLNGVTYQVAAQIKP